ncbi:MAG: PLP-dependent aminotransferase family protein [Candidatus Acidiferrales bacterium]
MHRQIYDAFRAAIVDRSLSSGQQIPSSRALAAELGISRIPALNAYAQLLAEGYFEARVGAGTYVSSSLPEQAIRSEHRRASPARADGGPRRVSRSSLALPRFQREPWVRIQGAFSVSLPAQDAFPSKVWANLVARHGRALASSLYYGDPMGLQGLREAVAAYLRTSRAVRCEPQQIMIVSGSQQALDLSARVLLDAGNPVWVEEPGYWLARDVLTAAGCRMVPVPVDRDGLDVSAGIKRCRNARAAFVAPSHQHPLGVTMSAARRLQLLEWARRAGSWIIEDDYDSEYRYETKPIASLQGLDSASRVIYIGTFSKVLFPSLRVGYVVIPPDLVERFLAMRHAMDVGPPHLSQAVLADFIAEGHFSRHLRRMRSLYGERRGALVESLQRECGSLLQVIGESAGMHLAVTLATGMDDREICMRAAREELCLWPLSPAYIGKAAEHGFILGFGSIAPEEIPGAVRHLRSLVEGVS